MAIGIVAGDAAAEPENFAHAEKIPEALFDCVATQSRIPIWIEQTRFGREQRGGTIHLDRAAFQDHARIKNRNIEKLRETCRHNFIKIERRILVSPGIVIPVSNCELWLAIAGQKNWPVIAAPRLVCRNEMKRDSFHR